MKTPLLSLMTVAMLLISWQDRAYREFKPIPPHHRFGVPFDDYVPQNASRRASP